MRLKSTMKYRRLKSRLLISMLTVALRFSYLLISKDNVYRASVNNIYSTTHYTITQDINYDMAISGTANLNPKMQVTICRYKFDFDGYYDGKYIAIFNTWPANTYFVDISSNNCQITGYDSTSDTIEIQFNGVQHCEIVFKVYQILSSSLNSQPPYPNLDFINSYFNTFTYICSSPTYIQERINSKLSDIKGYVDGIEGALSTLANSLVSVNTNLVTINGSVIDVYNRLNVTNTKLDTINNGINGISSQFVYSDTQPHNLMRTLENTNFHTADTAEYLRQIKDIVKDLNPTQQTNIDTEINTYNTISGQVDTIINTNINTALGNFPSINNAVNNFIANNITTMNKVRSAVTSIMPTQLNTLFGTYFMLMAFGMLIVVMLG